MSLEILTSMRYDPQLSDDVFYMLPRHRDRMLRAARGFDWPAAIAKLADDKGLQELRKYSDKLVGNAKGPKRIRLRMDESGALSGDVGTTPMLSLDDLYPKKLNQESVNSMHGQWNVYLDSVATHPSSLTRYKTTSRDMYNEARARAGMDATSRAEVILYNDDEEIMDGSITNLYVWRDGWVTPPLSSGGQDGTTREYSLELGLAREEVVHKTSLRIGETIYLSNGVRGFIRGVLRPHPGSPA